MVATRSQRKVLIDSLKRSIATYKIRQLDLQVRMIYHVDTHAKARELSRVAVTVCRRRGGRQRIAKIEASQAKLRHAFNVLSNVAAVKYKRYGLCLFLLQAAVKGDVGAMSRFVGTRQRDRDQITQLQVKVRTYIHRPCL